MGITPSLQITLDKYPPIYNPGEDVKGYLIICCNRSTVSQVKLTIIGRARTWWHEGGGRNYRSYSHQYIFFEEEIIILDGGRLTGDEAFEIHFQLPANIPPCIKLPYGRIEYKIKATARTAIYDNNDNVYFSVEEKGFPSHLRLHLNLRSLILPRVQTGKGIRFSYRLEVDRVLFYSGENIQFSLKIDKAMHPFVYGAKVRLMQIVKYTGKVQTLPDSLNEIMHIEEKELDRCVMNGQRECEHHGKLRIPEDCITFGIGHVCKIIDVTYEIQMKLVPYHFSGKCKNDNTLEILVIPSNCGGSSQSPISSPRLDNRGVSSISQFDQKLANFWSGLPSSSTHWQIQG